jgi:Skp family chaperone for outer membrane proteins
MTKFARLFILAVLACTAAFAQAEKAAPATAPAPAGPTKIGIIDIQKAIAFSNEGRRDFEVLQKKFEPKQTQLQGLQKELADLQDRLKTQGDKLNDDARNSLTNQIQTKQKNLQRDFEDAQGDFQNQQSEIVNRIGGKLMKVLDKYAKDNGYTLILDVSTQQSPVLWASTATDVTEPVVNAYNTESGVPAPATPTAPAAKAPTAPHPTGAAPAKK